MISDNLDPLPTSFHASQVYCPCLFLFISGNDNIAPVPSLPPLSFFHFILQMGLQLALHWMVTSSPSHTVCVICDTVIVNGPSKVNETNYIIG